MNRPRRMGRVVLVVASMLIVLSGCRPQGEPAEVIEAYYTDILQGDYVAAFEKLTELNQKSFGQEEFVLLQRLYAETTPLKEFKVEKKREVKDLNFNGTNYKYGVVFKVVETTEDYYNGKKESFTYERTVVADNGHWKVLRDESSLKSAIARAYDMLGWMYLEGKGKTRDVNQGAMMFNKAIEMDEQYAPAYYSLAVAYITVGRYDEAIEKAETYLSKAQDPSEQSMAYNVLGLGYSSKGDYVKARDAYKKALELDPKNEYARTNLTAVEAFLGK